MPLTEANSLVEGDSSDSTPGLVEPHQPEVDLDVLAELAVWCQQFSPLVGWETVAAKSLRGKRPANSTSKTGAAKTGTATTDTTTLGGSPSVDFLLFDVTGLGSIFGDEARMAELVAKSFRGRDLYASVAVASCIGAAWALARYGRFFAEPPVRLSGKPLGKSGAALPRSRSWFAAEEAEEIGRLPTEALRIASGVVESLRCLGVKRIEELERLPKSSLPSRFGAALPLRLEQLRGRAPESLIAHRSPDEFHSVWVGDTPTSRQADVEEVVRRLIGEVCKLLDRRDRGAIRLQCVVHLHEKPAEQLQVELFQPTCNAEHLWDLMRMQLEQFRLGGAAVKIELSAAISAPLEIQQAELFGDAKRSRTRQFAMLLDRLAARLGGHRVLRPRLTADPQPERSCVLEPAGSGSHRKRRTASKRRHIAAHRPLQLFSPPCELPAAPVGECPPRQFLHERQSHRVAKHWGPERIETGWWRGPSVQRDYYRIETEEGNRFWLFRELNHPRWFLHGAYG